MLLQFGNRLDVGTDDVKALYNSVTLPIAYISAYTILITCSSSRWPMKADTQTYIPGITGQTMSDFGICYNSTVSTNASFYWFTIGI